MNSSPSLQSIRPSKATLRWRLLRHYLLSSPGLVIEDELLEVSRRPNGCFDLIPYQPLCSQKMVNHKSNLEGISRDVNNTLVEYSLPSSPSVKLVLLQRWDNGIDLSDFNVCHEHQIDNTGVVGLWPAEEVLTHFCLSHPALFRNKRVVELGSGYGLAGLAIAACTQATEVLITDGNPQVFEYVEQNINANRASFGETMVSASLLHWCCERFPGLENKFDFVIAADCTFFKATHIDLARTVNSLLRKSKECQALFFSPQRGDSLDKFVGTAKSMPLNVTVEEQYDAYIWGIHKQISEGKRISWPNYAPEHCYPLLVSMTHTHLGNEEEDVV